MSVEHERRAASGSFARQALLASGGLIVWFAHFSLIYAANALVCARGLARHELFGIGVSPLAIALLTLLALAVLLAIWRRARAPRGATAADAAEPRSACMLRFLAAGSVLFGAVAIVWETLAVLLACPCG